MSLLFKNCLIIRSQGIDEADILIEGERIKKVGRNLKNEGETVDVRGGLVMAGVIDSHVHVRDWAESYKEDYASASMAALSGGVTTILEMPNTKPRITDMDVLRKRVELGEKHSLVDFGIHLGFDPKVKPPQDLSLPSVKVYMDSMDEGVEGDVERAFKLDFALTLHCEDPRIIRRNQDFAQDTDDFLVHADIREDVAESSALDLAVKLSKKYSRRCHICHVTLGKSIKKLSPLMTSEVTPHHLLLTEKDLRSLKGFAKTNPPLRPKMDVYSLWQEVKAGNVDVIASDHAPHSLEEKRGDVQTAPSGIPNLDIMLRLMLDLVSRGALRFEDLARMMCENPARIFRVQRKGFIEPGFDADLLFIDPDKESVIDPVKFHSKAKYSPFHGRKTKGSVEKVYLKGRLAYEEDEFRVKPGFGRYLYG